MSDPNLSDGTPPELSAEYAEAYRRAYERALRGELAGDPGAAPPATQEPGEDTQVHVPVFDDPVEHEEPVRPAEPTQRLEGFDYLFAAQPPPPAEPEVVDAPTHRDEPPRERPAWFVLALLGGLALLLILAAFGLGRLFSSSVGETDMTSDGPDRVVLGDGDGSGSGGGGSSPAGDGSKKGRYDGRTQAAAIGGAQASCESAPSVDAAGNTVRYAPGNTYDGDLTTAWRCDGDGVGQTLVLSLAEATRVGEVGLVPGYAKTDPRSGADRYAENNRITRVRWTFSDGSSVVQRLDGSPRNRDLQTMRVPLTRTDQVRIEVLESVRGPRNTIAISEVRVGAAAD